MENDFLKKLEEDEIIKLYSEVKGIYGYRRITLNINNRLNSNYNHKRIYRLMKSIKLTAVIRKKKKRYIQSTPQITAENILNRNFTANKPNEKWLTDVTEFKLTNGSKDNGPMEGFWGTLKSEMYYLRKFDTYEELEQAINEYIEFYNTKRLQKKLKCMAPFEYRSHILVA